MFFTQIFFLTAWNFFLRKKHLDNMSQNESLSQQEAPAAASSSQPTTKISNNEILAELISLYEDQKDFKRVENIKIITSKITQTQKQQQDELDAMVIELNKRIDQADQQAQRAEPAEEHQKRLTFLQRHLDEVKFNVQQLQGESDELSQKWQTYELQLATLIKEEQAMLQQHSSAVNRTKTSISLFRKLAPITWHEPQPNKVKGFFTHPDTLIGFDYDLTQTAPFDVTNHLWNIITQRVKA